MTGVRDFVAGLARAGKDFAEIQDTVKKAFGDKALKRTQIYEVIRKVKAGENTVDQHFRNPKKTKRHHTVDPSTVILRNYAYNSGFVCYISMNHSLNKTLGYWGLLD